MNPPQLKQPSAAIAAAAQNGHVNLPPPSPVVTQVAVVVVPLPAQGHLNQLLHISHRLASSYNIPVHYVGAATHIHQAKLRAHDTLHSSTKNLHFHHLEIPPFESPPPNPNSASKFPNHLMPVFEASSHLRSPVGSLIKALSETSRRVVVIHDSLMASVVQDVASVPNAESYIFHSVSAFAVYWYMCEAAGKRMPLVEVVEGDGGSVLMEEHLQPTIEGCFSAEFLKFIARQYEFRPLSSGSLYNTCRLVEGPYLKLLEKETAQKHWAIGPFNPVIKHRSDDIKSPGSGGGRHKCLEWLDHRPPNSVIYVSFGTTTSLSQGQIYAIAAALEKSKQRFIWVLREADKGDIFNDGDPTKGIVELPEGYEQRVEGVGLVVREWVPQLEILGHPSTGGFMSHCGWNSCMESISMGLPLAAWPMHSDQPRNSMLVTNILRIGTMVREWFGHGWNEGEVGSVEIERAVRVLMACAEGDGMRKRASALGSSVQESVGAGGVSRAELDSFVLHISR